MSINTTGIPGTLEWFVRAVPSPTKKNQNVQLGCHLEEVCEMLAAVEGDDGGSRVLLSMAKTQLHELAEALKKDRASVSIHDRKEFLDGIADQMVTGTGCAHMHSMKPVEALDRTNESNWSKFKDGQPIFDEHGKIAKNKETFFKPNLEGLY
jgi:hypothetical protein